MSRSGRCRGRDWAFLGAVSMMAIPFQVALIPQTMTSGGDPVNLPTTVRLANLAGSLSSAGPVTSAAAFVQAAIPLLVFFGLQRHIVRGLLAGSING